ncbi:MAG: cupin domain-containing protein [Solirubrobacteraceae bacterium]|jgi:quercetin dioxygenase-like cupin family protein
MELSLISLEEPVERRVFEKGYFELYRVGPMTIGRATYEPGWVWSEHVGTADNARWCEVEHVGLVVSGRAAVAMRDGPERVMEPGQLFYVPPGHDSWVVGEEPYVSLHFMGSESYAAD